MMALVLLKNLDITVQAGLMLLLPPTVEFLRV